MLPNVLADVTPDKFIPKLQNIERDYILDSAEKLLVNEVMTQTAKT